MLIPGKNCVELRNDHFQNLETIESSFCRDVEKMPRTKPTSTVEHRISLSTYERQRLEEYLKDSKESKLYVAGISQIGAVAGSGVLLWAAGAWLGISAFEKGKEYIQTFVDSTSTGLADMYNEIIWNGERFTTEEARMTTKVFNTIDAGIAAEKEMFKETNMIISALFKQLENGDLTFDQFKIENQANKTEQTRLLGIQVSLAKAKRLAKWYQGRRAKNSSEQLPTWFNTDGWTNLIIITDAINDEFIPSTFRPDLTPYGGVNRG